MSQIQCQNYSICINEAPSNFIDFIEKKNYSKIFILVDENTQKYCLPALGPKLGKPGFVIISIPSGEAHKNLDTCRSIWSQLLTSGADRHSVLLNLGGGVIGDLGGFAASCFMRGIDFIQIPTTLLAQVDSSVGGKTGIDFKGIKNLIGQFEEAQFVWINPRFLDTLPSRHLINGFAELIKHALIRDPELWNMFKDHISLDDAISWKDWIHRSILIKKSVVEQDFKESGLRKILNFGHSIGHAIESQFIDSDKEVLHGEAIAAGMICEAYISTKKLSLTNKELSDITEYILNYFPHDPRLVSDRFEIKKALLHDKKNLRGGNRFSLLTQIGQCEYNIEVTDELVMESLEYYEGLG